MTDKLEKLRVETGNAFKRKDYAATVRLATKALAVDPGHLKLLNMRAAALSQMSHYELALVDLQKAIKEYPSHPRGYLQAFDIFQKMGKSKLAMESLRIALKKVDVSEPLYAEIEKRWVGIGGKRPSKENTDPSATKKVEMQEKRDDRPRENFGSFHLPAELIVTILRFIPITKTAQMMCLSRYWKELIRSSPLLWKSLDLSHYNRKIDNNALASLLSYSKDTIVDLSLANCSSISTLKPLITHRCRNLTSLDLSHTKLKNALIIEALKCMGKNVTSLSLSTTKVDNDTVRRILDICRKLERLSLVDCINLNDTAFEICDKFVAASIPMALKHFDASGTLITDKSIASLVKAAPRLQSINLSQNKKITNRSLVSLSSAKDLDVLILSGASLSNPPAFPFEPVFLALLANTTNLKVLELPNLPFLTDTCLEALATLCPGLESINIRGSANITSRGISFLAACPLKHVNISTCPRLQNECVIHIFSVPTLQTIDLSSLGQLTDAIFETIEGQASNLTSLKIRSNPNITSQGIPKLTKKAGCQLNELNVDNCPRVSRDSLSVIKKSFPACKISSLFT